MSLRPAKKGHAVVDEQEVDNRIELGDAQASGAAPRKQSIPTFDNGFKVVDENDAPAYNTDFEVGDVKVVTTAQDLVTTVISLTDDPSLNPWTFRMFFLGRCIFVASSIMSHGLIAILQALGFPSSAPSYRRSFTSSLRRYTSQSFL